jgi:hypothetical protein
MPDAITTPNAAWINPIESRKQRADYYFQTILAGQQDWYSKNATRKKKLHYGLAVAVVMLGALVSCLQALETDWIRYVTSLLGAGITILRSLDSLIHPGETWQAYRKAEEHMKREYRLYINNADVYGGAADERAAYQLLVTRVEQAIAEEQQLFWQAQDKNPPSTDTSDKDNA